MSSINLLLNKLLIAKDLKDKKNKISNNNISMNPWIMHVKNYAAKHGMKYNEALKDPQCKASYKKGAGLGRVKNVKRMLGAGIIDESEFADQALIAQRYNDSELGANAGKKYISF